MSSTEQLADLIREIAAEGVEATCDERIERALDEYRPEIDADNVSGLDRFVETAIDDWRDNGLADFVHGVLDDCLADKVRGVIADDNMIDFAGHPAFQKAVDEAVQKALAGLVSRLLAPAPTAPPAA